MWYLQINADNDLVLSNLTIALFLKASSSVWDRFHCQKILDFATAKNAGGGVKVVFVQNLQLIILKPKLRKKMRK